MSSSGLRVLVSRGCLIVTILVIGTSLAGAQQPLDVAISVVPYPQPGAQVRVVQAELVGDDLRLELENNTAAPVSAIYLQYDLYAPAGCTPDHERPVSATMVSSENGSRSAGMISLDIPANGRVSYSHHRIASYLADSAVKAMKSRYALVHVEINRATFVDGNKAEWQNPSLGNPESRVAAGICAQYPWDSSIQGIQGFRDTPKNPVPSEPFVTPTGEPGFAYTCSLLDEYITCPKAQ